MKLNSENYFSEKMLMKYLSASQYKDFAGTTGKPGCEAMAMAKLRGEWQQEMTISLMVGSYVDAHFEGTLDVFKSQHPDIICIYNHLFSWAWRIRVGFSFWDRSTCTIYRYLALRKIYR